MKIEGDLKLAITRIEEQTDFDGNLFFKCKGFSPKSMTRELQNG